MTAFDSKWEYEKLAPSLALPPQTTHLLVLDRTAKKMCKHLKRTCTAIVLLFKPFIGDVLVLVLVK